MSEPFEGIGEPEPKKDLWEEKLDQVLHPKPASHPESHKPTPSQADRIARKSTHEKPHARDATPPVRPKHDTPKLPATVDLGEQIVGSEHWFTVTTLSVADVKPPSYVSVDVERAQPDPNVPESLRLAGEESPFDVGNYQYTPKLSGDRLVTEVPLRVRFRPKATGHFHADLVVGVSWFDDDTRITQRISIFGQARALRDAPEQPYHPGTLQRPPLPAQKKNHRLPDGEDVAYFERNVRLAADAATRLAKRQALGLDVAQGEIGSGITKQPKPSVAALLADLAITMAIGGVAQVVGKAIARNLLSWANAVNSKGEIHARLLDGTGSAFKDGLKTIAKGVVSSHSTTQEDDSGNPHQYSKDAVVDFFARQKAHLIDMESANRKLITDEEQRVIPILGDEPAIAHSYFAQLATSFEQSNPIEIQARATVAQWISGIAQETLGTEVVHRNGISTPTTQISPRNHAGKAGLLEIYAHVDGPTSGDIDLDRIKLDSAEIHGVPFAAADHVRNGNLLTLGIPLRIVLRTKQSTVFISRDEVGRIQIEHTRSAGLNNRDNIQLNREGEAIANHLGSRSLAAWGIELTTDVGSNSKKAGKP